MQIKASETHLTRAQSNPLASAAEQSTEIAGTAARNSPPETATGYGPATQVTLSGKRTAAARGNTVPDEDPIQSSIKFREDLIKGEEKFLQNLQKGEPLIIWKTKKPITDPLIIEKYKESSTRIIFDNRKILNDLYAIAAGGNPSAQTAAAIAPSETVGPASLSPAAEVIKPVVESVQKSTQASVWSEETVKARNAALAAYGAEAARANFESPTTVTIGGEAIKRFNYQEEYAKDPVQAVIKEREGFIRSDKAHLAKLERGDEIFDFITAKVITEPRILEQMKASTRRSIEFHEKVLQDHLIIAAGGNPSGQTTFTTARSETVESVSVLPTPEVIKTASQPIQKSTQSNPDLNDVARKAVASTNSGALLLDILTKGNEAYLAATKKKLTNNKLDGA
jgi:hypothetical protein